MCVYVTMPGDATEIDDRRQRERTCVALDLRLVAPEVPVSAPSRTINLSPHGAFVRTSRPLPVGTRLQVALYRGEHRNPLTLEAVVVRAHPDDAGRARGMAVKFTDLTPLDENIVAELIRRARC
ncbi:MAG: hypothetical protein B7733_12100 [Myxococcales bacterium FL481]|nr:MAG: hypothetical protein B7733_12100 [Myxococcales bacterium FL481]